MRRFVLAGVRHHWRTHLAVGLGAALAVAVLAGSLLVGHSAQATLQGLNLRRLGPVALWITSPRGVPEGLAERLDGVGLLSVSASATEPGRGVTVPEARIFGVDEAFWRLFPRGEAPRPQGRRVLVNSSLALDLGLKEGDALIVGVRRAWDAPMFSLFGRRERGDVLGRMRLVVEGVLSEGTLDSFHPGSKAPRSRTLFMERDWLNGQVGEPGHINRILFPSQETRRPPGTDEAELRRLLKEAVSLEDVGLSLSAAEGRDFAVLRSDRLVLSQSFAEKMRGVGQDKGFSSSLVSVYLANSLEVGQRSIPYSVVSSLDPWPERTPLEAGGTVGLEGDEMVLNTWAADDLGVAPGDTVLMRGFVVGPMGGLAEIERRYRAKGSVPMDWPYVAPWLVPEVEGVTDGKTIRDWDTPFPVERDRIREKDEVYWESHRASPKAFLSPSSMKAWWNSDEWIAGVVFRPSTKPPGEEVWSSLARELAKEIDPGEFGLSPVDLRNEALEAARGSTDFGGTFLAMSFFLVVAAAFWVGLLLRLNVETRAKEYGVLASVGFRRREIARILSWEAWCVSLAGGVLGVPLAAAYAGWVLEGLRTRWQGALGSFSFHLDLHPSPLLLGFFGGMAVAAVSIRAGVRHLEKREPLELLWGWASSRLGEELASKPGFPVGASVAAAAAAVLFAASSVFSLLDTTVAFFGVGTALLIAFLLLARWSMRGFPARTAPREISAWRVAFRSARTNRSRSLLTLCVMSLASFIVVTVAANQKDLTRLDPWDSDSGTGGFSLAASSQIPLFEPLDAGEGVGVFPMRLRQGDGVSCLDLQRPDTPRVLSVPDRLIERGGFRFASLLEDAGGIGQEKGNPWTLLERKLPPETNDQGEEIPVVPAFMDAESAQWILKKKLGDTVEVRDKEGNPVRLKLTGFLAGSVFAADVLISESQFLRLWGGEGGYRRFLVDASRQERQDVADSLRRSLGDLGVDVAFTERVLADFAQVQNAYLGAFRLLGGFSLLWGGFGVAVSLLRGVAERRKELAMMRAVGLSLPQLAGMIVLENGCLLVLGVLAGTVSALVAVLPHLLSNVSSVNWGAVGATLCLAVGGGLLACAAAASFSVRRDLLSSLRFE